MSTPAAGAAPRPEPRFVPRGITPTAEQLAIQLERRKHVIVEANAGAAKTTTLALRLAQALERGASPERILALTYTAEAVEALRQALLRLGLGASVCKALRIQTFDAFCAARLQHHEGGSVPRHDKAEALKPVVLAAIERVMGNPDERHRDEFAIEGAGEGAVEGFLAAFARLKGTMQLTMEAADRTPSPALAQELGIDYLTLRTFWAYEHLRRGGHPDRHAFRAPNDATFDLAKMLLDEEAFVGLSHPLAMGLHLVLVDEMHDTNRAMFTVLQHLLGHNASAAFVGVGDRDQVIHAVAGADADFMGQAFDREIAPAHRAPLSASYRFGPALAAVAGRLAHKAYASAASRHTDVELLACAQAKEVHWHIVQAVQQRSGLSPQAHACELAILLRQPHQSVGLENHLLDKGVAYRTVGFDTYLMRPEVLFVRGLIAHARGAFADIAHLDTRVRILQALLMFCGAHVDSEHESAEDRLRDEHAAVRGVANTPELAGYFIDNQVLRHAHAATRRRVLAALDVLRADTTDSLLGQFVQALAPQELAARVLVRRDDIDQVAANIQGLVQSADTFDHVTAFFRAMNERELRQQAMRGKDCIVISSIEAAKGLEFDHVLMPGLNRGEFALGGLVADHRNLLYVGMTRARNRLTLFYDPARPSKFLADARLL